MTQINDARLPTVTSRPGRPLYESVKDALLLAIDQGVFASNRRLPSTKELSERMSVSLVTAHRALQELEAAGVLERTQGRGTFVIDRQQRSNRKLRLGLVLHAEASLADFYHSRVLEGMRQACRDGATELTILSFGSTFPRDLDGYLLVNPLAEELEETADRLREQPGKLVVGARSHLPNVASIDVDNREVAVKAVEHLHALGHRRIGYIGNEPRLSNSRDRWDGFGAAMRRLGVSVEMRHVMHVADWRLDNAEKMRLHRLLTAPDRPTAIFAAGYYYALDVYEAVGTLGLRLPRDLSLVGVDNPPSAAHLSPTLTTVQQPLQELGHAAVMSLTELARHQHVPVSQVLRPELVIRQSSASVREII